MEVRNKFQIFGKEPATGMYERFINAISETAKETLETAPKRKKDQPFSENKRIKQAREDMEKAYQEFVGSGKNGLYTYIEAKSNLNKIYEALMGEDLDKKIEEIEKCHRNNQASQSWKLIREITGKGFLTAMPNQGSPTDDRLRAWHIHYKSLLGNPPVIEKWRKWFPSTETCPLRMDRLH